MGAEAERLETARLQAWEADLLETEPEACVTKAPENDLHQKPRAAAQHPPTPERAENDCQKWRKRHAKPEQIGQHVWLE